MFNKLRIAAVDLSNEGQQYTLPAPPLNLAVKKAGKAAGLSKSGGSD